MLRRRKRSRLDGAAAFPPLTAVTAEPKFGLALPGRQRFAFSAAERSGARSLETTVARLGNRRHRMSTLSHVAQGSFRKGRQRPSLFADDDPIVLAGETFFAL